MAINIDKLKAFRIPEGRQTLSSRDIANYALSIGMGRVDPGEVPLDYVDPLRGPVVMPAMVLVMAHPGFWMGDPASGIDPTGVLHMEQQFEIQGSVPDSGEVTSASEVTEVIDKGPGKAGIVKVRTDLFDASRQKFAELNRTVYIKGGGGFGGDGGAPVDPLAPPEGNPDAVIDLTTGQDQALFYRLHGDFNPLHSDQATAEKAGFKRPILHGLCTMGVIAHAILRELGDYRAEALRAMSLRFRSPVYPGETIRTEIWNDGRFLARALERDEVVVDEGKAVIGQLELSETGTG